MPWVSVADSEIGFTFDSGSSVLTGSRVTFTDENGTNSGWRMDFSQPARVRVTVESYRAATGYAGNLYGPAKFYFGPDQEVRNEAPPWPSENMPDDDAVTSFIPEAPESEGEVSWVEYDSTLIGGEMRRDESFSMLVEVWVEGEVVANDDYSSVVAGGSVATNVLANDTVGGEPATLETVTLPVITRHPEHGVATVNEDGTITYTPNPGTDATEDSYEYEILPATPGCATVVEEYNYDAGRYEYSVTGLSGDFNLTEGDEIYLTDNDGDSYTWELGLFVDASGVLYSSGDWYGDVPFGATAEAFIQKVDGEDVVASQCAVITLQERL